MIYGPMGPTRTSPMELGSVRPPGGFHPDTLYGVGLTGVRIGRVEGDAADH